MVLFCVNIPQFINPTVTGHLASSQIGITESAAMSIPTHFLWRTLYRFLWGRNKSWHVGYGYTQLE